MTAISNNTKTVAAKTKAKAKTNTPKVKSGATKPAADFAKAIAKSWDEASVRKARTTRHAVKANGKEYGSAVLAFKALGLPLSRLVTFRLKLKASKKAVFEDGKRKVAFVLAA